jgi:two-component system, cell cycle sensor histidine kinase and response regulator CckA
MANTKRWDNMIAGVRTILYVEDNVRSRRLLRSILTDCGFEVVATGDPEEAIREFNKLPFDAALIGHRMPTISGPDLALKLKTFRPGVPVVMLYGTAVFPDGELVSVDAHFGSGTSLDDLLATLRTLTGSRAEQRIRGAKAGWLHST